jgi:hypothetical protein
MAQTKETEVLDPHENSQRAVLEHDSPDGDAPELFGAPGRSFNR